MGNNNTKSNTFLINSEKYIGRKILVIDVVYYSELYKKTTQELYYNKLEQDYAIFVLSEGERAITWQLNDDGSAIMNICEIERPLVKRTIHASCPGYWF